MNFSPKVSIKRPGLFQVLRASVDENQGNLDFSKKELYESKMLSSQGIESVS